jgi:hypothetical protein
MKRAAGIEQVLADGLRNGVAVIHRLHGEGHEVLQLAVARAFRERRFFSTRRSGLHGGA